MIYIIANWKMYFTYNQTENWLKNYRSTLEMLCTKKAIKLVVCPSYESIVLAQSLVGSSIFLGAQDCSPYSLGAHSGQVSAASLKELMCRYCIVGHSEQRMYAHETDAVIKEKITQLCAQAITPIVCIGETHEEYTKGFTFETLQRQLESLSGLFTQKILIAYEPIWAIGTGNIPPTDHLKDVYIFIEQKIKSMGRQDNAILYGGSITPESITYINRLKLFEGFLIGKASTDIEQLSGIMQQL